MGPSLADRRLAPSAASLRCWSSSTKLVSAAKDRASVRHTQPPRRGVLFSVEAYGRVVGQQVSDHILEEVAQKPLRRASLLSVPPRPQESTMNSCRPLARSEVPGDQF